MLIHIVYNHLARAAGKLFRYVCLFLMRFLNCLARNGRRKNVQFAMILPPCPSSMLILKRGSSRSALENVKKGGAWVSCFSQGVPRSDRFWKGALVRAQLWNATAAIFLRWYPDFGCWKLTKIGHAPNKKRKVHLHSASKDPTKTNQNA